MKPIQQRRPFFQAVGPLKRQQRFERTQPRASLFLAAVISAALLFCSCASLTNDRVAVLAAIAGQAAQLGAEEWLKKHPTHREAFNITIAAIRGLVARGVTDPAEYVSLLESLPTSQLGVRAGPFVADSGQLMWSGKSKTGYGDTRLMIWDGEMQKTVIIEGAAVLPVMKSVTTGLKVAVAPKPPMPGVKKRSPYTLELNPGAPTNNAYPPGWQTNAGLRILPEPPPIDTNAAGLTVPVALTDAQLDAEFEAVKAKLKPNADYAIERRDGTNWLRFITITNSPVAEWRVLRLR